VRASFTTANSGLKHNWITALAPVGEEWFAGTYGAGVQRFDSSGRWSTFLDATGDLEVNPNAMLVTPNYVLAGTLGRGLYVYDRRRERWSPVTRGLPSLNVTALASSGGMIYVGTDNGLIRFPEQQMPF
jgi:outer membrane protein assembly factor BamB